jgi:general stress protein 26
MHDPITTLDPRRSIPNAVAIGWEETRHVLETAGVYWLSTVRADGRPHVTPLVAVWHDDAIYFNADDTAQKGINLRANPHVVLTTGCNSWQEALDVVIEGDAVRITDQDQLETLAKVWATAWDGESWIYQVRDGCFYIVAARSEPSFVFRVAPSKVFVFARGENMGQTRHQF